MKQLDGKENLEPINLGLPILRELGAKWLVEMAEYFKERTPRSLSMGSFKLELQML